jgi:hypothetical protein
MSQVSQVDGLHVVSVASGQVPKRDRSAAPNVVLEVELHTTGRRFAKDWKCSIVGLLMLHDLDELLGLDATCVLRVDVSSPAGPALFLAHEVDQPLALVIGHAPILA